MGSKIGLWIQKLLKELDKIKVLLGKHLEQKGNQRKDKLLIKYKKYNFDMENDRDREFIEQKVAEYMFKLFGIYVLCTVVSTILVYFVISFWIPLLF